jgi:hypothetical protein
LNGYFEATENAKFDYIVDAIGPIKNKLKEVVPVDENKSIVYVPTPNMPGHIPQPYYPTLDPDGWAQS